ncbi:MAG: ribonuclease H [Candidatus Komeilibacteria bacterium CG_4_10_14_0_2_um_filter_37_10]|uniref:Ribonuclease H n=1 Tax=Candidatus Komeilibacteria bacterium CG_4_10_14_0_2_um_filter_37_10 TaxID=1974470 RepID=A0A2M7VG29_9BACT|nr:MAG: ribonuclease H [Candidatus Komeilibacteria bacterium CG_4_10_14_0_2_um_filter_37_10]PJA93099.1 MAG: ribonuclease H [Candidatus Komeilibacteria bacterium CG_4_9_14_3_um_filter_37_5]
MLKHIKLYSDGGSRGNPGPAAGAYVIKDTSEKIVDQGSIYLGEATNNVAEYSALLLGLTKAVELDIEQVDVFADSELLIKQLKGEYKVRDLTLAKLFVKIWNCQLKFKKISFCHIPRERNCAADQLVNEMLDRQLAKKR